MAREFWTDWQLFEHPSGRYVIDQRVVTEKGIMTQETYLDGCDGSLGYCQAGPFNGGKEETVIREQIGKFPEANLPIVEPARKFDLTPANPSETVILPNREPVPIIQGLNIAEFAERNEVENTSTGDGF